MDGHAFDTYRERFSDFPTFPAEKNARLSYARARSIGMGLVTVAGDYFAIGVNLNVPVKSEHIPSGFCR